MMAPNYGDTEKDNQSAKSPSRLILHRTARFFVWGLASENCLNYESQPTKTIMSVPLATSPAAIPTGGHIPIFLDMNDKYVRNIILSAFSGSNRQQYFHVLLGPEEGDDTISPPSPPHSLRPPPKGKLCCEQTNQSPKHYFQFSEYERIDWPAVMSGVHGASSYCIRKGISRKAQLATYTRRYILKQRQKLEQRQVLGRHQKNRATSEMNTDINSSFKDLAKGLPETVVIDTWSVFDDEGDNTTEMGGVFVGGMIAGNVNQRKKLDHCLSDAKDAMKNAETLFENYQSQQNSRGNLEPKNDSYLQMEPPIWILKGSTTNRGTAIHLIYCYEQLLDICWDESGIREWVLQKYVSPPLLLNRRKFHIRAYVLAHSAIDVYLYDYALALCAGTRYPSNEVEVGNEMAHITNTSFQARDPNFNEESCIFLWDLSEDNDQEVIISSEENENFFRSPIAQILVEDGRCKSLFEANNQVSKVNAQIRKITSELFRAYRNEFGVYVPLEHCFEHYGLDFIVDNNFDAYLLEVNPSPDFKQTGARLSNVVKYFMEETIDIVFLGKGHKRQTEEEDVNDELFFDLRGKNNTNSDKTPAKGNKFGRMSHIYSHQMRSAAASKF